MVVFGQKWLYSSRGGFIPAKWLYSVKVVVLGQGGCIRSKRVVFGIKVVVFGQSSCIRAKVVVFGQKLFYSVK